MKKLPMMIGTVILAEAFVLEDGLNMMVHLSSSEFYISQHLLRSCCRLYHMSRKYQSAKTIENINIKISKKSIEHDLKF